MMTLLFIGAAWLLVLTLFVLARIRATDRREHRRLLKNHRRETRKRCETYEERSKAISEEWKR